MKIFISGASGLIGSNCLVHFSEQGYDVIGTHLSFPTNHTHYFNTLDLDHPDNFDLMNFIPDVIVHCGALTHVDYCEEHQAESFEKTVQSTINLALLAKNINAKFILLSTDYVFDGKDGPYDESAVTNPLSVYGKHKLEAERYVQEHCPDHLILRVTNVYGDEIRNKNFVARIVEQCKNGAQLSLNLPIDQYASPTNAYDIARAMCLLVRDDKKGIYHIGSTDYMNRVTLALNVLHHFPEAKYELHSLSTNDLNQKAPRPLLGGFISKRFNEEYPNFRFGNVNDYVSKK